MSLSITLDSKLQVCNFIKRRLPLVFPNLFIENPWTTVSVNVDQALRYQFANTNNRLSNFQSEILNRRGSEKIECLGGLKEFRAWIFVHGRNSLRSPPPGTHFFSDLLLFNVSDWKFPPSPPPPSRKGRADTVKIKGHF